MNNINRPAIDHSLASDVEGVCISLLSAAYDGDIAGLLASLEMMLAKTFILTFSPEQLERILAQHQANLKQAIDALTERKEKLS